MNMFRAWSTKTKEMIYIDDLYWFEENGVHDFNGSGHYDNYIIMKASGLPDENQDEIYEGDIVRFYFSAFGDEPGTEMIDEVKFEDGHFVFWCEDVRSYAYACRFNDICKIIGNIYENPELLSSSNSD